MMKRLGKLGLPLALVFLAAGVVFGDLKDSERKRLDAIKSMHADEVAKAQQRYQRAVEEANQKAKTAFNAMIQQYKRAGDTTTADALQQELDVLLKSEASDGAESAPKGLNKELIGMIGPELISADGRRIKTSELGSVPHVLLYYSASWCGPCRAFTPKLVDFYNENAESKRVMVVLVGRDRSAQEQSAYMTGHKMPWPAVPFERIEASGLLAKYGGRGIPNLVLLNTDGTVASGSYVDGKYLGPTKVLDDLRKILAEESKASAQ